MKKYVKEKIGIIIVIILGLFGNLWVSTPDIMEIRNFVAAREMVTDGTWIVPTMNGAFRFEKPPLPTWITASFMKIVGIDSPEWILRIPAAIMGIIFIIFLYKFVKKLTGNEIYSLLACFIAPTTVMFTNLSNENMWDIYTYVFTYIAVYCTLKGFVDNKIKNYILAGVMLGASILSKGPVGIYIIYSSFLISYSIAYDKQILKKNWKKIILSLMIGIFLASLWLLAMYLKNKDVFLTGVFESIMNKEVKTWTNRKQESIFYYLDYPIYCGIWMFPLVFGFIKKWSFKRTEYKKFLKLGIIWNLFIFIFLTSVGMKKKRYTLPMYFVSPIIITTVCSYYLTEIKEKIEKSDKVLILLQRILMVILCIGVPFIFIVFGYPTKAVSIYYVIGCIIVFGSLLWIPLKGNYKQIIIGSGIILLLGNLSVNWYIDRELRVAIKYKRAVRHDLPILSELRTKPLAEEVYSFNPDPREVWSMGKKIINLDKYTKNEIDNLPSKLLFLSSTEEKDILEKFKEYKIKSVKKYLRMEGSKNIMYIYELEK